MAGMRREYNPDRAKRRKRRPIIYIVCEGKETETKYFRHFRTRNCLVDVIPITSKYQAAEHLVKHVKGLLSQSDYFPKDGDQIWCVFDRDDNSDAALQAAEAYAAKQGYKIAYSNPCFEYWYLLHFAGFSGYLNSANDVLRLLESPGRLERYEKNADVFPQLLPGQKAAIVRAEKRVADLQNDHTPLLCRNSNPVTTVHELVKFLNRQSE